MRQVTIVGLGPGALRLISLEALETLQQAEQVILRTRKHPAVEEFARYGVRYAACDDLYETHSTFEAVYQAILARVLAAADSRPVVYAVPGDPLVAEQTVRLLLDAADADADLRVTLLPSLGAVNLLLTRLRLDAGEGVLIADARDPRLRPQAEAPRPDDVDAYHGAPGLNTTVPTLWLQVDLPIIASNLKIILLERYPPEHLVTVLTAVGADEEEVTTVPLAELDRGPAITHLTSLYVPPLPWAQRRFTVGDVRAIMALLRGPHGCPWDREQDMRGIRRTVIEEAYEAVDAIDRDDPEGLAGELGDLLLNIIFLAQLGAEDGVFDFDDVVGTLAEKLIRRHAHVFGDTEAHTTAAVLASWEQIKAGERAEKGETHIFDDVPHALPALARSQKLQKRAARVGFDWLDFRGPLAKLHEELEELSDELGITEHWERPPLLRDPLTPHPGVAARVQQAPVARLVHEVGDILFAAVNLCRFLHLDAEEVMREANDRFVRRFHRVEAAVHARGHRVEDLPLVELDQIWLEVKGDD